MEETTTEPLRDPHTARLAVVAAGAVLVAGAALLVLPATNRPLAAASLIVSLSSVFLFACVSRWLAAGDDGTWTRPAEEPTDPQSLPHAPELLVAQHTLTHYIRELGQQSDEILREAAMLKLVSIQDEVRALADGKVSFSATEGWRTLYERLLRSPDVQSYRSVAWVRSEDYWRDAPGQRSMQLNFEIVRAGVAIERILILNDFFWPPAALLPSADISRWIDEQHEGGVQVSLVRESEIESEPDLFCDLGIYGNRATGWLELDTQCRTSRFTYDFSQESLQIADERWKKLSLYAVPFAELLERTERAG